MTDTTPNFDPIPRLQQIAATIEESGADIFDAPATAVHYIECAIKEIERLRKDLDEARRRVCEMLHEEGYGRSPEEWAKRKGWDCFKENKEKTNGYR
jgi:hypothetical protein